MPRIVIVIALNSAISNRDRDNNLHAAPSLVEQSDGSGKSKADSAWRTRLVVRNTFLIDIDRARTWPFGNAGHDASASEACDLSDTDLTQDEAHPLAEVLDLIAMQVKAYEDAHVQIPEAKPHEVLAFLMDQHSLKQSDLDDCAPQNRISEILSGKRVISKEVAKKLAQRFHVHADLFL